MLRVLSLGAGVQSIEAAWAAGFFDGEGNVRVERSQDGRRSYLCVSVGQADEISLRRFQTAVGGVGHIYGPYQRPTPWRPIWSFLARGAAARAVLAVILPYCSSVKKRQAESAIAAEQTGGGLDYNRHKKTCPRGHEYDDSNTYVDPQGVRHCRACQRTRDRARRAA